MFHVTDVVRANKLDCPHAMGTKRFQHSGQSHFVTFAVTIAVACLPLTRAAESSKKLGTGAPEITDFTFTATW